MEQNQMSVAELSEWLDAQPCGLEVVIGPLPDGGMGLVLLDAHCEIANSIELVFFL